MYKLGWFSTGRDKAARDLLTVAQENIRHDGIKANIEFVFCNRRPVSDPETAKFIHLANAYYKLPILYLPWQEFRQFYWSERTTLKKTTEGNQLSFLPPPQTRLQAPHPMLLESGSFHRRTPRQRQYRRRKAAPLYQMPLLPYGYQIPLLPAELPPLQHDAYEQWRLAYDRRIMNQLQEFDFHPDLCVLAGYMLIVGEEMCQRYNMINLHPAAPGGPKGTWQEVIWQLIESKAEETGVMMHVVTPELDMGPPATYCTFSIRGKPFDRYWQELAKLPTNSHKMYHGKNQLFRLIRKHGLAREFPLIISTLKSFSQGKVGIEKGKVVDADGKPINGYNLTTEIDKQIKESS